jgi:hypothetical protein
MGLRGVYKAVERVYSNETRADFLETALNGAASIPANASWPLAAEPDFQPCCAV